MVRARFEKEGIALKVLSLADGLPTVEQLESCRALVIIGGDGTVNACLMAASKAGVPVYHYPTGTENLFARELGMKASVDDVVARVKGGEFIRLDQVEMTTAGEPPRSRPVAIMASMGPDAGVIRRLTARRKGPISHLSYLRPIVSELIDPSCPRITLWVDGKQVVNEARGMLVVANSRHYGARFDPALAASVTDGLLDVVFFPAGGSLSWMAWMFSSRARAHRLSPKLLYMQGRSVRVTTGSTPCPVQVDGELAEPGDGPLDVQWSVNPQAFSALALPGSKR